MYNFLLLWGNPEKNPARNERELKRQNGYRSDNISGLTAGTLFVDA
jgi:hypothetical protein